mmetsp:Transcript_129405/g.182441  ORF Transcript_129405/g.182441 Transcript_129405/m.182441 type:complete len:166 (+) Transcript_129405:63-560(+)
MANKRDPNMVHVLILRAIGGEPANMATLAPKLGPIGMPPKKVSDEIMKATKDWKGLKVTVKVSIQNRVPTVEIIPSSSALLLKALKEPPRDRKKVKNIVHDGNLSLEDVYGVARIMRERSQAREFSGTVCEILGTCMSIGCTVEGQAPRDLIAQIKAKEMVCPEN